jgi:alpha-tubulin suppressor-like RCC1 family protein
MAVSAEGDVYGWGKGKGGRIGLGLSDVDILLPRRIHLGEIKAIDVECGYLHSVIVGLNGSIFMCGGMLGKEENNTSGQHHEDSEQIECSCNEGKLIRLFSQLFFDFSLFFLFCI